MDYNPIAAACNRFESFDKFQNELNKFLELLLRLTPEEYYKNDTKKFQGKEFTFFATSNFIGFAHVLKGDEDKPVKLAKFLIGLKKLSEEEWKNNKEYDQKRDEWIKEESKKTEKNEYVE